MRFITPLFIFFVFITALLTPKNNDWNTAFRNLRTGKVWILDQNSIIGKIYNKGIVANRSYFSRHFESETEGQVMKIGEEGGKKMIRIGDQLTWYHDSSGRLRKLSPGMRLPAGVNSFDSLTAVASYRLPAKAHILVAPGSPVRIGSKLADGILFVNNIFYIDMAKLLLALVFLGTALLVFAASRRRGLKY